MERVGVNQIRPILSRDLGLGDGAGEMVDAF